ncbi:hypothetical protein V8E36_005427 [Tilletia maclaganii]
MAAARQMRGPCRHTKLWPFLVLWWVRRVGRISVLPSSPSASPCRPSSALSPTSSPSRRPFCPLTQIGPGKRQTAWLDYHSPRSSLAGPSCSSQLYSNLPKHKVGFRLFAAASVPDASASARKTSTPARRISSVWSRLPRACAGAIGPWHPTPPCAACKLPSARRRTSTSTRTVAATRPVTMTIFTATAPARTITASASTVTAPPLTITFTTTAISIETQMITVNAPASSSCAPPAPTVVPNDPCAGLPPCKDSEMFQQCNRQLNSWPGGSYVDLCLRCMADGVGSEACSWPWTGALVEHQCEPGLACSYATGCCTA